MRPNIIQWLDSPSEALSSVEHPLHCHYSNDHLGMELKYMLESYL